MTLFRRRNRSAAGEAEVASPASADRRSFLKRSLVGAGGAVAVGAAPALAVGRARPPKISDKRTTLKLAGADFDQAASDDGAGNSYGRLAFEDGRNAGHFHSTSLQGTSRFADGAGVEFHTFELEDGSLFGMGSARGEDGTFAIVGGTGNYAAVQGYYEASRRSRRRGGDGGADFKMNLWR